MSSSGVAYFVAGQPGLVGYSGDGGPAVNATLNNPLVGSISSTGVIYILDKYNNRVRKVIFCRFVNFDCLTQQNQVDTNGIISTVIGNGVASYFGDGGPATGASIKYPSGMTFDTNGNIFVVERDGQRVRKVTVIDLFESINNESTDTSA